MRRAIKIIIFEDIKMISYNNWRKLIMWLLMIIWTVFVVFRMVKYFTFTELNLKELVLGSFAMLVQIIVGNGFIYMISTNVSKVKCFFNKEERTKLISQNHWLKLLMWLFIILWTTIVVVRDCYYFVVSELNQYGLVFGALALLAQLLAGNGVIFIIFFAGSKLAKFFKKTKM